MDEIKRWVIYDNINNNYFETNFDGVLNRNVWHSYDLFYKENYGCEFSINNSVYEMFDCILKKDDIVLDLGANIGLFTNRAAKIAKKVIAVEGAPELFSCLVKNTYEHKNIEYLNANVVSDNIIKEKHIWSDRPSRLNVTLQDIFNIYDLSKLDFLKVDIESAEYDIFHENLNINLLSNIDRISMEVHVNPKDTDNPRLISLIKCLSRGKKFNYFDWYMNGHLQKTFFFKNI